MFSMAVFSTLRSDGQGANNHTGKVRVVVAGITHGHVGWILGKKPNDDVEIAGIYEPDTVLSSKYALRYQLSRDLFYTNLNTALEQTKPEAVLAFGSIHQHLKVVQAAAPRGIHVMVEKPLASNLKEALEMKALADKYHIRLLTNYETSWYPATVKTYSLVNDSNYVGHIKKVVFHHGHEGPKEIGVGPEFLNWLTDPVQNGGGAVVDFGCYGANIMTYLMRGQKPDAVTAVTRQFKPGVYPEVDDDATIIVDYPNTQAIIMASWNWTTGRKDMEVYGDSAYIIAVNNQKMRLRKSRNSEEKEIIVTDKDVAVYTDPFSYLHDVLRGKIKVEPFGLYSLENNMMVNRILEAAKESAKSGKKIYLN